MAVRGRNYVKKAKRALARRYGAQRKSTPQETRKGVGRLMRDVSYLKSVLNPEKKRTTAAGLSYLGQVNGNAHGSYVVDISPQPSEGAGYSQRNGSSLKLHSTNFEFQMVDMPSQVNNVKIIIDIFQIKGISSQTLGTNLLPQYCNNIYSNNNFVSGYTGTAFVDYFSSRNPDFFKTVKLIRSYKATLMADQTSGAVSTSSHRFGIKYNRGKGTHIRFNGDSNTYGNMIVDGQLVMIVRADRGNMSTSAVSTCSGIADLAVSTGLNFKWALTHYFYDN